jgi:hypothetical protein
MTPAPAATTELALIAIKDAPKIFLIKDSSVEKLNMAEEVVILGNSEML